MASSTTMLLGIKFPLVLVLLYIGDSNGDPTIILGAPAMSGVGGMYGMGGPVHSPFFFDRDDIDVVMGPVGYNAPVMSPVMPPIMPQVMPMTDNRQPTIVVLGNSQPGHTNIINNDMPIPGVRYVMPNRRSSPRRYQRRRNSYRRRFGYYG